MELVSVVEVSEPWSLGKNEEVNQSEPVGEMGQDVDDRDTG